MSYSEYAAHIDHKMESSRIDDAYHVAPIEPWELADFEDILPAF